MSVAISDFWKLAIASRLLSAEDCQQLEAGFAHVNGAGQGNAATLSEWLVANGALSRFQAQTLLAGRPGPFLYGEYCVYERIRSKEGRLAGLFRAVHMPTRHPTLLYFLPKELATSTEAWPAAVQQIAWACWTGHPYVCDCYQLLELGKIKFAAIENLTGETLATRLTGNARLTVPDACLLARQAALGLSRLHQLGQIHGEVRPENLWLGADGMLKLLQVPLAPEPLRGPGPIDWNQPDSTGKLLQIADYAAPEINEPGRMPDVPGDLYSLGVTLFELLSGWAPFPGGDLASKRSRYVMEQPPQLEPFGVPPELAQVVSYLLAKDPSQRYQQAAQVADALAYFVDPAMLQAVPATPPTLAMFDQWLQQQPRVPGAEPGAIPTASQMANQSAADYAAAQQMAAQQMAAYGADPYAQGAAQAYAPAAQPMMEQPYVAPLEPAAGGIDFAAQYAADTYGKIDEFVVPAAPSYGAEPLVEAGGGYFERPAPPDPFAFVAANPAPPAYADVTGGGYAAGAQVAIHEPPAFAPPASDVGAPEVGTAPARVDLGGLVEPAASAARPRKPTSKGLDPKILLIGGGGLLVVLLCLGVFIATRSREPEVAIVTTPIVTPPPVKPPVDKPKGTGTGDKGTHPGVVPPKGTDTKTDGGGETPPKPPPKVKEVPPKDTNINDDGTSLWSSPTSGAPLELTYVAAGAQAILNIRPASILRRENGDQFLPSLGPWGDIAVKMLKTLSGLDPPQIKQVVVIWHDTGNGQLAPTITIRSDDKIAPEALLAGWGNPTATKEGDESYYQGAAWSYYLPSKEAGQVLVVGQTAQIKDIIQSAANGPPAMSRYMERILQGTDAERDITLVLLPDVLFTDHQWFFAGELASLRKPMESFFGPETKAAAISADLQGDLFLELRVLGSADNDPNAFAGQFASRIHTLPDAVESALDDLNLHKYDRKLLRRFPEQLRVLAVNVRNDADDDEALLRCYLPSVAAHNLLISSELAMAEQPLQAGGGAGGEKVQTVAELLHKKTTLVFPRDTLEKSLQMLFDDIGIKHEIMGGDLQLEGITKNQSFGLDEKDKPAIDILLKILKQANPDGKLVYVIKPKQPGGPEMLFITTRASAAKRGDKLPTELQQATPPAKGPVKKK